MSRLRQYFANRYSSSEATNSEFENVIRYLNTAELGNRTLAELMEKIFDSNGDVNLGIEFRFNPSTGLEFRLDSNEPEWTLLAATESIRGTSGSNVGTIESPLFSNRVDFTSTASQTVFPYVTSATDAAVMVWINGVLQATAAYTYSSAAGTVTLASPVSAGQLVSLATIRTNPATAYRRADLTASESQVTFPFPHTDTEDLVVYRNGILQREGGGFDYIRSPATSTVTMTSSQTAGNVISIICITNNAIRDVAGIMLEDEYAVNGLIRLDRINISANAIGQDKVNGLVDDLSARAKITVSGSSPLSPGQGDLWVNTSFSVPTLLFYDGVRWLNSSPNGLIPLPLPANVLQFLRLNSTATALEYAPFDTSGLVLLSSVGAANGVAALNANGKLQSGAVPEFAMRSPIIGRIGGAVANGTYVIGHISGSIHVFDGIVAKLTSGSATLQLQVGGVNVGSTLAATSASTRLPITASTQDATAAVRDVAIVVTGATSPVDLTYNVSNYISG
jgi:hypothetical protein